MGKIVKSAVLMAVTVLFVIAGTAAAGMYEVPDVTTVDFVDVVDNVYWPLIPGTVYVYQSEADDELTVNQVAVTYEKKVVMGVACTVVYDVEWVNGLISEETFDWYAQDTGGNVWYFGEDTMEYVYDDDGNLLEISTEGSWEAGVDGATPGIVMLADPEVGLSYRQEYYEGEAEDMGKVLSLNAGVFIDLGEFGDCLKTKEWTHLDPGVIEHKYYAPGMGLVFIEELKGKTVHVELVVVDHF